MANPLYDSLFGAHANKDTVFLVLPDGSKITHAEFLSIGSRFAIKLSQLGLKPGDRVAVQVEKSPEALALYCACVQAGLVFLPLNPAYTVDELSYFVSDSGSALIVCDDQRRLGLTSVASASGAKIETLNADGSGSLADFSGLTEMVFQTVDRQPNDLAAILYTSGTTGRSKGAMLTQNNLLSNAKTLAKQWRFTAGDVLLHALPIFHTHGLFVATNTTLVAGGSMKFFPRFDLDQIIESIPDATSMMGVPTFYTRLLDDLRLTESLTANMRLFVSGSAPLLAETHVQFEKRTGHKILERYGMTETNMNTSNPYDGERKPGTVGPPLEGVEVKITDPETNQTLPSNEIGQIEIRGPNVFAGYWNMPEKTAEELRADGFFISGDLGMFDDDGYLQIVGRNKDLIISGGYNIYPKEIELILDEQNGVLESAVIGVPHPDLGETVLGLIVPGSGERPDLAEIETAIRQSLGRFKHPKKLIIVDSLPRNTMGKVQKNLLREQYDNLFAN
jgi:malonyl-CoA/methylmalonyl-CoA synthetase